jgi:hypothetical protein
VVESLLAGVDHFLLREPRERQARAFEALVRAGETRPEVRQRIVESAQRVSRFKAQHRVPMPMPAEALASALGTPANRALAASFARVAFSSAAHSPVVDA